LLWTFPYTTLASKFNANSQLLALWPWVAACMVASWQNTGLRGLAWTLGLALTAATALLTKYYSGVFLLGLGITSLLSAAGRNWLRSYRPWLALAVLALFLTPHLRWLQQHDYITLRYAQEQGAGGTNWKYVFKFAVTPVIYWLPAWASCLYLTRHHRRGQGVKSWLFHALRSWLPHGWDDVLFWLAFLPWLLTLLFGISGAAELSTPWAIPIGYAFPLLWLRNLASPQEAVRVNSSVMRSGRWGLVVVIAVACGGAIFNAWRGKSDYYRPDAEAAHAIQNWWRQQYPAQPLRWVGGNWAANALLPFYGDDPGIRAVAGLPGVFPATIDAYAQWSEEGGILLCPLGAVDGTSRRSPSQMGDQCEVQVEQWLLSKGQSVMRREFALQRSGWRFPKPKVFLYAAYPYTPLKR
ncbi:MAG: glycosyltransferase family 39 protein, partial [Brachymonas sp.]|nr:glycosyltransferase family 39 protein [Brachymonas sp.]